MGKLLDGRWVSDEAFADADGEYRRQPSTFRGQIRKDGSTPFLPEAGRYQLYVSLACPWAHRVLIARALLGLEAALPTTVVHPVWGDDGWSFGGRPECEPDPVLGARHVYELYVHARPDFTGRATVPLLYDRQTRTIVNNDSRELLRMLDLEFDVPSARVSLFPTALRDDVEATIDALYPSVNNGVYRAGFASSQEAYEKAVRDLFAALDGFEARLSNRPFLCGDALTAADICLFTTLVRFDSVYYVHFKCNVRRITEYPHLWRFTRELYGDPRIAATCNFDHIKQHYYRSHPRLNPSRIVPVGPLLDFTR